MAVAHLAFDFRFRGQRRNRIDYDHVHRVRAHEHVGNFQRLLTGIRLGNQQLINVNTQLFRINRVQCVLGIHKGTGFTLFLRFRDNLQSQRGFTGALRAVNLNDPAVRKTTNAQSNIQPKGAGGYGRNRLTGLVAHLHYSTFTELTFDLAQRCAECFLAVIFHSCKPSLPGPLNLVGQCGRIRRKPE